MKRIITINRQFGSGGSKIGKLLAEELGFAFYDKELIAKVVAETGLNADYISRNEETMVSRFYPLTLGIPLAVSYDTPQSTVQTAETKIILQLGETQNCIIVGRCANQLLKDKAFKILIYSSDIEKRITRCYENHYAEKEMTKEEIKKNLLLIDKKRAQYYEYYTGEKWLDINGYNLCLDTAVLSPEQAVNTILTAFE